MFESKLDAAGITGAEILKYTQSSGGKHLAEVRAEVHDAKEGREIKARAEGLIASVRKNCQGVLRRQLFPGKSQVVRPVVKVGQGEEPLRYRPPTDDPDHAHYMFTGKHLFTERERVAQWEKDDISSMCLADPNMVKTKACSTGHSAVQVKLSGPGGFKMTCTKAFFYDRFHWPVTHLQSRQPCFRTVRRFCTNFPTQLALRWKGLTLPGHIAARCQFAYLGASCR